MKLLADAGISLKTVAALRRQGHDVMHLIEERLERLPDSDILRRASSEERVVLTFDLDFGDILGNRSRSVSFCRHFPFAGSKTSIGDLPTLAGFGKGK